jgi:hypothetical protein
MARGLQNPASTRPDLPARRFLPQGYQQLATPRRRGNQTFSCLIVTKNLALFRTTRAELFPTPDEFSTVALAIRELL